MMHIGCFIPYKSYGICETAILALNFLTKIVLFLMSLELIIKLTDMRIKQTLKKSRGYVTSFLFHNSLLRKGTFVICHSLGLLVLPVSMFDLCKTEIRSFRKY